MYKIAVVDDDKNAIDTLSSIISSYAVSSNESSIITPFTSGASFLESSDSFDIVFLDVEMPYIDGIETAKRFRERDKGCIIIYVTNVRRCAIDGYKVGALDYVIKPINENSLRGVLHRAFRQLKADGAPSILIQGKGKTYKVKPKDIVYVTVVGHEVIYRLEDMEIDSWGSLAEASKNLPDSQFYRLNSTCLVNLDYVESFDTETVLVFGAKFRMPRGKKDAFRSALALYLGR